MADTKVSDLPALNGVDVDPADLLYIVDSSAGAAGSKKITVGQYQVAPYSAGTANGVMYLNGSNVVTTGAGLTFDGSNLGLGVTPSAWDSTYKALQTGRGAYGADNGSVNLSHNAYYSSGWKYIASSVQASQYDQFQGIHRWFTAPSGTAGNAISFTQAMTLGSDGNLVVGTTASGWATSGRQTVEVNGSSSALVGLRVAAGTNGYMLHDGTDMTVANNQSGYLRFVTNTTERARITSGGDLLVGRTTNLNSNRFLVSAPDLVAGVNVENGTGEAYRFYSNTTAVGTITVTGSATAYNTSSDQRLKKNIQDAPAASDLIDAIQVRSFDWIADDSHQRYGMVAQELAQVAPEAVYEPADHDEMMAVDYSKLVPMLIKEIQSLRARVAALEAQ